MAKHPPSTTAQKLHRGSRRSGSGFNETKAYTDDRLIREELRDRFAADRQIDPTHIRVDVKDGAVCLYGEIENLEMKDMASRVAESVPGVQEVDNRLEIRRSPTQGERSPSFH